MRFPTLPFFKSRTTSSQASNGSALDSVPNQFTPVGQSLPATDVKPKVSDTPHSSSIAASNVTQGNSSEYSKHLAVSPSGSPSRKRFRGSPTPEVERDVEPIVKLPERDPNELAAFSTPGVPLNGHAEEYGANESDHSMHPSHESTTSAERPTITGIPMQQDEVDQSGEGNGGEESLEEAMYQPIFKKRRRSTEDDEEWKPYSTAHATRNRSGRFISKRITGLNGQSSQSLRIEPAPKKRRMSTGNAQDAQTHTKHSLRDGTGRFAPKDGFGGVVQISSIEATPRYQRASSADPATTQNDGKHSIRDSTGRFAPKRLFTQEGNSNAIWPAPDARAIVTPQRGQHSKRSEDGGTQSSKHSVRDQHGRFTPKEAGSTLRRTVSNGSATIADAGRRHSIRNVDVGSSQRSTAREHSRRKADRFTTPKSVPSSASKHSVRDTTGRFTSSIGNPPAQLRSASYNDIAKDRYRESEASDAQPNDNSHANDHADERLPSSVDLPSIKSESSLNLSMFSSSRASSTRADSVLLNKPLNYIEDNVPHLALSEAIAKACASLLECGLDDQAYTLTRVSAQAATDDDSLALLQNLDKAELGNVSSAATYRDMIARLDSNQRDRWDKAVIDGKEMRGEPNSGHSNIALIARKQSHDGMFDVREIPFTKSSNPYSGDEDFTQSSPRRTRLKTTTDGTKPYTLPKRAARQRAKENLAADPYAEYNAWIRQQEETSNGPTGAAASPSRHTRNNSSLSLVVGTTERPPNDSIAAGVHAGPTGASRSPPQSPTTPSRSAPEHQQAYHNEKATPRESVLAEETSLIHRDHEQPIAATTEVTLESPATSFSNQAQQRVHTPPLPSNFDGSISDTRSTTHRNVTPGNDAASANISDTGTASRLMKGEPSSANKKKQGASDGCYNGIDRNTTEIAQAGINAFESNQSRITLDQSLDLPKENTNRAAYAPHVVAQQVSPTPSETSAEAGLTPVSNRSVEIWPAVRVLPNNRLATAKTRIAERSTHDAKQSLDDSSSEAREKHRQHQVTRHNIVKQKRSRHRQSRHEPTNVNDRIPMGRDSQSKRPEAAKPTTNGDGPNVKASRITQASGRRTRKRKRNHAARKARNSQYNELASVISAGLGNQRMLPQFNQLVTGTLEISSNKPARDITGNLRPDADEVKHRATPKEAGPEDVEGRTVRRKQQKKKDRKRRRMSPERQREDGSLPQIEQTLTERANKKTRADETRERRSADLSTSDLPIKKEQEVADIFDEHEARRLHKEAKAQRKAARAERWRRKEERRVKRAEKRLKSGGYGSTQEDKTGARVRSPSVEI